MLAAQYFCKPVKTHISYMFMNNLLLNFLVFLAVVILTGTIHEASVQMKRFMGFSYP